MKLSRLLSLLPAAVLLVSCVQQGVTDLSDFMQDNTVRLEMDGKTIFRYNPSDCQLAFNEKRCEFRAHTDTMLDYFVLTLDALPASSGQTVNGVLAWSTPGGERTKENIALKAVLIRGDVIWLCDKSYRNAVVVRVLK